MMTGEDHEIGSEIAALRSVLQMLTVRDESPFRVPVLISHAVEAERAGPERLRSYATGAVNARIFLFSLSVIYRTRYFIELYLDAYENRNPFGMLFAARAQIELFAVSSDVARVLEESAIGDDAQLGDRVIKVDKMLIGATLGTRSQAVKDTVRAEGGSVVRSPDEGDIQAIEAVNILTRIRRASQHSEYVEIAEDYERLCEYLHPNIGQTILLIVEESADTAKFSTLASEPMARAVNVSLTPMRRAAELCAKQAFDPVLPFGQPRFGYPRSM